MHKCERMGCQNQTQVYGCPHCPECADRYRFEHYSITPMGKPRMTQADKWKKRPEVLRYWAFKEECKLKRVQVPESGAHIIFVLPMPQSWSRKKKQAMVGKPHQQKPDRDNMEKALLDAVFGDDSVVWDARTTKIWGWQGAIRIEYPICEEIQL